MIEGWYGEEYLILFADSEVAAASDRYSISRFLPGFEILGIRSWDDFIIRDTGDRTFLVPAVPIDQRHLSPIHMPENADLKPDDRFRGRIKWYIKPLAFGGDPQSEQNTIWIDHNQHASQVTWWNDLYRSISPPPAR